MIRIGTLCCFLAAVAAAGLPVVPARAETVFESFEGNYGPWRPGSYMALAYHVTPSHLAAYDGQWSLDFTTNGTGDNGTVWMVRELQLPAGTWNVGLEFHVTAAPPGMANQWHAIGFIGLYEPTTETHFTQSPEGQDFGAMSAVGGWATYSMQRTLNVGAPTVAYVAFGYNVVYEVVNTHYFDAVTLTGVPVQCGNGQCFAGETPCNCSADCGPPGATEALCSDGRDDDCDNLVDCSDPDCDTPGCAGIECDGDGVCEPGETPCDCWMDCGPPPVVETSCSDGIDNDCDGDVDCDDMFDCFGSLDCMGPILFTLTVNVTGQGSVVRDPPGPTYALGTTVTLTADAMSGWHFDHWEGALSGSANPTTLVMNSNKTVTAVFLSDAGGPTILLSFTSTTNVPGVGNVENEDIVAYDVGAGSWSLYFDGSDVGLASFSINALARLPSGELLISVDAAGSLAGLVGGPSGTSIDDSDIIKFTPTSLGSTTAGTWNFYFDGSDVSLTTNAEDVDALAVTADGKLLISTLDAPGVSGLSGLADEDLIQFTPTSLGAATAGTWSYYFDGSDVGLANSSNEDVDAAARTAAGDLLLSTLGSFSVSGVSGADEDVFRFTPTQLGATTSGTFQMYLDLSALGIATGANVNAVEIIE